jgi:hypothetical protein
MAQLNSPGVSVTVVDESFYNSAGPGTVPFIMIATAQDKINAAGTEIAEGTQQVNAGKLYQISSQRELLQTFGNPNFKSLNGTPVHGDPLNEYGLLAAYSYLGASNSAFVMRADIDLEKLEPSILPPRTMPADDTYWLNTETMIPAIYEWDGSKWVNQPVFIATEWKNLDTYGDSSDIIPVGVPSNYEYVVLAGKWPIYDHVVNTSGQTAADAIDYNSFPVPQNAVCKRVSGKYYWYASALYASSQPPSPATNGDPSDGNRFQYSDVYPATQPDNTALEVADVWFNTRQNVYELKQYDSSSNTYATVSYPINVSYNEGLEYYGGLSNIQNGSVIAISGNNFSFGVITGASLGVMSFYEWTGSTSRYGQLTVEPDYVEALTPGLVFYLIDETISPIGNRTVNVPVTGTVTDVIETINGNSSLAAYGVTVSYDANFKKYKFDSVYGKSYAIGAGASDGLVVGIDMDQTPLWGLEITGWQAIEMVASATAPTMDGSTVDGTYWYSEEFKVDILENDGTGNWIDLTVDLYVQSKEPTAPNAGDLWIDTVKVEEYPYIQRRVGGDWELVDNTDQTTPDGIIFADVRVDPTEANDIDAPDALRYPSGMLIFNTRYSTRNVKQRKIDYYYQDSLVGDRWVSVSGLKPDGSPYMGSDAVNRIVTRKMQEAMAASEEARSEDIFFNLIASPGYPELIDEMVNLNIDRKETAFIIGDCPFTLAPNTTEIVDWATNKNNAITNGKDGLITADENLAVYYPCGIATNLDGTEVAVPPSHMILRTMAYNDQVAYQWFAPAGLQRGVISNATSVGYVNDEGEFEPVSLSEGLRDALYTNNVNPIRLMQNRGPVVWGQKTRSPVSSALDRINVARLVNYIRFQAPRIVEPFLFEQNDAITRKSAKAVMDNFMSELARLRGVYDWVTVCDESNNTTTRIDRNELWIDILVKPEKAIEFIYIPVRLRRTGDDLTL